jgi:hypothetical protein
MVQNADGYGDFVFNTYGTGNVRSNKMVILGSSGNVGIGTTSPNDLLEIKTTSANQANVRLYNTFNSGASSNGLVWFRDYDAATNALGAYIYYTRTGGSAGDMTFGTGTNSSVGERMRISSTGKTTITSTNVDILYLNSTSQTYITIQNNGTAVSYLGSAGQLINGGAANDMALTSNNNNIIFGTSGGTERMRITSGGVVNIGSNTPSAWSGRTVLQVYNGGVNWGSAAGTGGSTGFYNNGYWNGSADKAIAAGYSQILALNDNGSGRVQVLTTSGTYAADATISYVQGPYVAAGGNSWTNGSSDVRKKKNFEPSQGLNELLQIEAIKYHFIWEEDNAPKRLGFKAQNLQGLIPEMVVSTGDKAPDGTDYLSITPDYILPVLVKAIQEQQTQIQALQAQINK